MRAQPQPRWRVFVLTLTIAAVFAEFPSAASAQSPASASAPPAAVTAPAARSVLNEGVQITVQLVRDIRTNDVGQGDPVEFTVSEDVYSSDPRHTLILPKGSIAMGRVISRSKAWDHGISGKLTITCEYALAANGEKVWLRPCPQRTGAVIEPLQAKHSSEPVQLERGIMRRSIGFSAGSQFVVYVDQDFDVKVGD